MKTDIKLTAEEAELIRKYIQTPDPCPCKEHTSCSECQKSIEYHGLEKALIAHGNEVFVIAGQLKTITLLYRALIKLQSTYESEFDKFMQTWGEDVTRWCNYILCSEDDDD